MRTRRRLFALLTIIAILTSGLGISYGETGAQVPISYGDAGTQALQEGVSSETAAFTDIGGHWAESAIKQAASLGIVGGYPDRTFKPDHLIKREEFYKLLTNILTVIPDTANTVVRFTDVDEDEWYAPVIKIAVASGITSGYGDGTFGVGLMISRQEAAKVAGSVIPSGVSPSAGGVKNISDQKAIADWAYEYVDLMFKKGYMRGDTEGNFRPTMALTRAEAATILLNVKKNEPIIAAKADSLAGSSCLAVHSGGEGVFTAGNGTQAEPYEIYTEAQLNHVRMHATEGAFYILKKNIAITKDFTAMVPKDPDDPDWSEGNFEPIGSKQTPFRGSLDGNGFTVSGLNIIGTEGRGDGKKAAGYAGLFGYLAAGSSVADLNIDASTISGGKYTGAIAGYCEGSVKDCQLGRKGIVNGGSDTGGLVGYSSYPLSSLRNMGTVKGSGMNTGGIVGSISAPGTALRYCQNEGSVTGSEKTGGIAGSFTSPLNSESVVRECHNKGTVQGGSSQTGGIAGYAGAGYYSAVIEDCSNSGEVTGSGTNGGITGLLDEGKSSVSHSWNSGTVEGNSAGGIAGQNRGKIMNCYNAGDVIGGVDGGGIAGYQTDGKGEIVHCYNEGSVVANSYSGGIAGQNGSAVSHSYNSGTVRGPGTSGGITGMNTGSVKYVYGAGVVTGGKNSGSLIGRNRGSMTTGFWLNTTNDKAIGLEDGSANVATVMRVTHEELSGQQKIKVQSGYEMLINQLNEKNKHWVYRYKILVPASGNTEVITDGGSIVPPLELPGTDSTGNKIDPADLNTKYLYPVLADGE